MIGRCFEAARSYNDEGTPRIYAKAQDVVDPNKPRCQTKGFSLHTCTLTDSTHRDAHMHTEASSNCAHVVDSCGEAP
jgi:hypothetical protein